MRARAGHLGLVLTAVAVLLGGGAGEAHLDERPRTVSVGGPVPGDEGSAMEPPGAAPSKAETDASDLATAPEAAETRPASAPAPATATDGAVAADEHAHSVVPVSPPPPPQMSSPPPTSDVASGAAASTSAPAETAPGLPSAGCGPSQASEAVAPVSSGPVTDLPPADPSAQVRGVEEGETPPNAPTCSSPG